MLTNQERFMKLSPVLIFAMAAINAAHAGPPACQDMADKVAKKFEAEKKMAGPSQAKCSAINLVISDLTDLATLCTQAAGDEKFLNETYMPLAKSIGEEAPKACER
jgi:hypothetical protein